MVLLASDRLRERHLLHSAPLPKPTTTSAAQRAAALPAFDQKHVSRRPLPPEDESSNNKESKKSTECALRFSSRGELLVVLNMEWLMVTNEKRNGSARGGHREGAKADSTSHDFTWQKETSEEKEG